VQLYFWNVLYETHRTQCWVYMRKETVYSQRRFKWTTWSCSETISVIFPDVGELTLHSPPPPPCNQDTTLIHTCTAKNSLKILPPKSYMICKYMRENLILLASRDYQKRLFFFSVFLLATLKFEHRASYSQGICSYCLSHYEFL
jgi:hypothetical protein